MSKLKVQGFEAEDVSVGWVYLTTGAEFTAVRSVVRPPSLVNAGLKRASTAINYVNLGGVERRRDLPATVTLSAKLAFKRAGVPVSLYSYSEGKVVDTEYTDSEGAVVFSELKFKQPGLHKYCVFPGKAYIPGVSEALGDVVGIKVYEILVRSNPVSDNWARFQGRSVQVCLPFFFWRYPGFCIGLAGFAEWIELIPVINGIKVRYEVGVSAFCNTPERFPPRSKCCQYRRNTWWEVEVAYRDDPRSGFTKAGSDQLNVSFHSVYSISYDGVVRKGRCVANFDPSGHTGLCGWEKGTKCCRE